jgi:curved DNA-binding protein CbpA
MDVITINNKQYDPYFILGVTKDDTIDFISKIFRKKVKKYHPDKYIDPKKKEKYECYFKILVESFEYIKNRRTNSHDLQINRKKENTIKDKKDIKVSSKKDIIEFNKEFKTKSKRSKKSKEIKESNEDQKSKESKESKESYKRIKNKEEYSEFKPYYFNPLTKKKFTKEEFNQIFEYNKKIQEIDEDRIKEKSLIHVTTDGFNAYNSGQLSTNCALVSSYKGLLITGDDFEELGIGYWGDDYSDYKLSFKLSAKNPTKKIKGNLETLPTSFIKKEKINNNESLNQQGSFKTQQEKFVKNTYESLLKKEKNDKEMVLKHLYKYDKDTVKKALKGELESSITYTSILQKHIN